MRMKIISAIVIVFLASSVASEEHDSDSIFNEALEYSSECQKICKQTYSLHTYDKPSDFNACSRGCRLFSICEWSVDDNDYNKTLESCSNACAEAYVGENERELLACKFGCQSSIEPAKGRKAKLEEEDPHIQLVIGNPFSSPSHLFFESLKMDPFDDFFSEVSKQPLMTRTDDVMQNILGFAFQLMNLDSVFPIGDNNTEEIIIINFHSPEINTHHPIGKLVELRTDGNDIGSKTTLDVESNLQTNLYGNHPRIEDFDFDREIWIPEYSAEYDHYDNPSVTNRFQEWWSCFTKKAGLPELTLFLFWLSTMVLLMMCCTMQFSPDKGYSKLSVPGDLAYIKESKGRLPEFLKVYGREDVVQFNEVKKYMPDEKIPIYEAC